MIDYTLYGHILDWYLDWLGTTLWYTCVLAFFFFCGAMIWRIWHQQ